MKRRKGAREDESRAPSELRPFVHAGEGSVRIFPLQPRHHHETTIPALESERLSDVSSITAESLGLEAVVTDPARAQVRSITIVVGPIAVALVIERNLRDQCAAFILDAHDLRAALNPEHVGQEPRTVTHAIGGPFGRSPIRSKSRPLVEPRSAVVAAIGDELPFPVEISCVIAP